MRRFLSLLVTLLVFGSGALYAQTKQVSGKVFSAEDNKPIPGVSVFVKEASSVGTSTNIDGQFTIKNVPANAKTLVFRFVGFKSQEVAIAGGEITVTLSSDTQKIDEVVVTAMGMKKSEKTLGYAATTVKSDDLLAGRSSSVMSGIVGKVAGVNVSTSGQTGSSQKVIVRGYSSFSGNQPLYVVDGVPIQNNFSGSGGSSDAVDFGNQAGDVNPDDVESVTVLKGASATALYGSRAANGVIMITTKKSQQNEQISVEYSGSFTASDILRVPQTQNIFGQGWPDWDRMENGSWGPKLDGRMHDWGAPLDKNGLFDPTAKGRMKKFSYVEDNMRNFYETGFETNNSVNVRGGTKNTGFILSYGNTFADGVIPTDVDKYSRNTFSFRGDTKYKNFEANYSVNYVRKDINNVSAGQGNNGSTIFPELLQHAVDVDFQDSKDLTNIYNNTDNYYTAYAENPWWVVKNNGNKYQDDRVYGKIELTYQLLPGLKAIGRLGGDFTNSRTQRWNAIATRTGGSYAAEGNKKNEVGSFSEETAGGDQIDLTTLLSATYKLTEDFNFDGVVGYNLNQRTNSYHNSSLYGLVQPNWYSLENGNVMPITNSGANRRRLLGAFSQFNVDFRNYWFLTVSLRNDWSSTLPVGKNSFFYWGANTAVILTDMFKGLQNDYLNFLKVRAAYGQTGNDAPVYRTGNQYLPAQLALSYGELHLPFDGVLGLTESNRLGNMNIKPEITTELEFGVDARLFNNRLSLDVAYYNKLTKDQIIAAIVAPEIGYTSRTQNIGEIENQGIEANLRVIPVRTSNLEWEVGVTFSKNKSKVKKLWEGTDRYRVTSGYDIDYMAIVGQPLGQFLAPAELRVADGVNAGKIIVNSSGRPLIDPTKKDNVGTSQADFTMGFNSRITYKGITLSGVLDWRKGGEFWSYTAHLMNFNGNATKTTFNERQPFVIPNSVKQSGVDAAGKPVYVENDIPVTNTGMYSYYNNSQNTPIQKSFVLPKDYVKLRELSISYSIPKKFFKGGYVKGLDLGFVGRNLFLWTPKDNNFVDPEATNYGNDITSELGEFAAAPTTRSFGGSIKIVF